jgi:hypothetical protein
MRYLLLTSLVFSCLYGKGQQVIDISRTDFNPAGEGMAQTSVNGLVYSPIKFVKLTAGSPFFKDQWMKGTLVLDDGKAYLNKQIRLNLFDNEVNYLDATGQEMVASSPIKRIVLNDTVSSVRYDFVLGDQLHSSDKSLGKIWFQVLVNDKVSLCDQIKKTMHESIAYGTATTDEDIVTANYYYLQMNGDLVRVKKWDELPELLKDKKDQINQYIGAHHLKGKSSDDFTQVVKYYNSLP